MIEWLPAVSVVDVHIAVAVLPLVPAATAAQPEIAAPPFPSGVANTPHPTPQ